MARQLPRSGRMLEELKAAKQLAANLPAGTKQPFVDSTGDDSSYLCYKDEHGQAWVLDLSGLMRVPDEIITVDGSPYRAKKAN